MNILCLSTELSSKAIFYDFLFTSIPLILFFSHGAITCREALSVISPLLLMEQKFIFSLFCAKVRIDKNSNDWLDFWAGKKRKP